MTIKELEERTGLTRANIRFYEAEGLLSPARLPNGYRDYSEGDAETLEKVRLLRRLRLDLDTIRRVQGGQLPLADALTEQERALERDRAEAEEARQVCRRLLDSGADYATLTPAPWLAALDRAPAGPHMAALPADRAETVDHPWVRLLARLLDGAVYGTVWTVLQLFVLGWLPVTGGEENLSRVVGWAAVIGLFFLLEPLLLSTWGYTPGKAIFGLKLRRADGGKLTYGQAARRLLGVYNHGQFWSIPIVELFFWWKSRKACLRGEPLPWEEGTSYILKDEATWRGLAFAGAYLALNLAVFPLTAQAMLPPNRGELTVAEFAENYNELARMVEYGRRLDEAGQVTHGEAESTQGATVVVIGDDREENDPVFTYTETDGALTRVEITWETEENGMVSVRNGEIELSWMALVTAQPGVNGLNYTGVLNRMVRAMEAGGSSWSGTVQGVECQVTAENSGYQEIAGILLPTEDTPQGGRRYSYTVVLTLTD